MALITHGPFHWDKYARATYTTCSASRLHKIRNTMGEVKSGPAGLDLGTNKSVFPEDAGRWHAAIRDRYPVRVRPCSRGTGRATN